LPRQDFGVSLKRLQLEVSSAWQRRQYTTDPPRYVPFDVWSLVIKLACAEPIRVVRLLTVGRELRWGMDGGPERSTVRTLRVRFHPNDWLHSNQVHMSFEQAAVSIDDADLKADPRKHVEIRTGDAVTGESTLVATLPRLGVSFSVIAFAHDDTETRRLERWRVHPRFKDQLPRQLRDLASGHQSGTATTL
jgi:hypothetical protein